MYGRVIFVLLPNKWMEEDVNSFLQDSAEWWFMISEKLVGNKMLLFVYVRTPILFRTSSSRFHWYSLEKCTYSICKQYLLSREYVPYSIFANS